MVKKIILSNLMAFVLLTGATTSFGVNLKVVVTNQTTSGFTVQTPGATITKGISLGVKAAEGATASRGSVEFGAISGDTQKLEVVQGGTGDKYSLTIKKKLSKGTVTATLKNPSGVEVAKGSNEELKAATNQIIILLTLTQAAPGLNQPLAADKIAADKSIGIMLF